MIGQKKLLNIIDNQIESNQFPKFSILLGEIGQGKKRLSKHIANRIGCDLVLFGNKIEDVRNCIEMAYTQTEKILYVIDGFDEMSIGGKNALLKLIEEPPHNAYIVILVRLKENLLETIISRGQLYELEQYTTEELIEFLEKKGVDNTEKYLIVCDSPGSIEKALDSNIDDILDLSKRVVDYIDKVTLANLLKVTKEIKLKEKDNGYDAGLFLNSLQNQLFSRMKTEKQLEERVKLVEFSGIVSKAKKDLFAKSLNKLMIIDQLLIGGWLLWNLNN